MNADIIVKSIIFNRKLNKFLLIQRCEKDSVGANTWKMLVEILSVAKFPKKL